jgi:hypothetical protein
LLFWERGGIITTGGQTMSKKDKLIKRLKSLPTDFTFEEMQTLLKYLEFKESNKGKTSGSRVLFMRGATPIMIHKPHPQNEFKEYTLKQVLEILKEEELI